MQSETNQPFRQVIHQSLLVSLIDRKKAMYLILDVYLYWPFRPVSTTIVVVRTIYHSSGLVTWHCSISLHMYKQVFVCGCVEFYYYSYT